MLIDGTKRKEDELTGTQPPMIGGQSSTITGTSNMAQTGTRGGTSSGGFTNLNKYLSANQGANNQTINKLNTTAQSSAKAAQDAITGATQVGTQAQQNLDQAKSDQDFVSSSLSDPLKTDVSRFNNLRTSFNANPSQSLSQFDQATSQANQVRGAKANELQNLTTSGGLTDWLRSQRQTPRYSQGSQSLDRFLIKGTDEGSQALQGIGEKASALQQEPTAFNELRSGIQTRAQSLDPNLMSAEQIANAVSQRRAQERQALMDYQNQQTLMGKDMTAGTGGEGILTPVNTGLIDRGGAMGATAQERAMQQYMRENDTGALVNRFTPEQIARYTALSRMSGSEPSDILAQNEQLYQNRLAETNRIREQYLSTRESERAQAQAQAAQAAEEERVRQEQLGLILASLGLANTGGGGFNSLTGALAGGAASGGLGTAASIAGAIAGA